MKLADLLAHLTALADRVSHEDRYVIFEALRRLRHGGTYVEKPIFRAPTPEQEAWWGVR